MSHYLALCPQEKSIISSDCLSSVTPKPEEKRLGCPSRVGLFPQVLHFYFSAKLILKKEMDIGMNRYEHI